MNLAEIEKEAIRLATEATKADQQLDYEKACILYLDASEALVLAKNSGSTIKNIDTKIDEYADRVKILKDSVGKRQRGSKTADQGDASILRDFEFAKLIFKNALDDDEDKRQGEAVDNYLQAAELLLSIKKSAVETGNERVSKQAADLVVKALDRVETLKGVTELSEGHADTQQQPLMVEQSVVAATSSAKGASYSADELAVLRRTSAVNAVSYLPFMPQDLRERFTANGGGRFSDPDGLLKLSRKQTAVFGDWARVSDLSDSPVIISNLSCFAIKQTIVSDCSFVASLTIAAQYEKRFKRSLISNRIYPQNKQGRPIFNPSGKYMIRLHFNGIDRKVVIDDQLPVDRRGGLLCSYSLNPDEFWISLFEKAYLKVMGGYDFPGSNSSIDLNALTGWIPQRISTRNSDDFKKDETFNMMKDRFYKGSCLITVATGNIPEVEADRAGLVPTHAYAVLDLRVVGVYRMLLLKNPWSHLRWKGRFSDSDTASWTPEMQSALNYNLANARANDNGVFWIDYDSLLNFFDVFYLNWDPKLFPHHSITHATWSGRDGPRKDAYDMSDNPQYRLSVSANTRASIWCVLTRHITDKADFAHNKEYITLIVYKNKGKKVFYPSDPPPHLDGVRINSPHYLCKIDHDPSNSDGEYTLVISQFEKASTLHFTLDIYASCPFQFNRFNDPYVAKYYQRVSGEWKGASAGGCPNNRSTYGNNPSYQLEVLGETGVKHSLQIELRAPKQFSVGFRVSALSGGRDNVDTGTYRPGFCVLQVQLFVGSYSITPSTFYPGNEGPFIFEFHSTTQLRIKPC